METKHSVTTEASVEADVADVIEALKSVERRLSALDRYGETWEARMSVANAVAALRIHVVGEP